MMRSLPAQWNLVADVVSVGSGGGGLGAAITAHDHGASALVLERSEMVGGVTAYSMGEVWIPGNHLQLAAGIADSTESGYRYVKRLSMGYGNDEAMLNQAVHAPVALKYFEDKIGLKMSVIRSLPDYYYPHTQDSLAEGRYLEVVPFPAKTLGDWQSRTRLSPLVPYGLTHADIFHNGGMANMLNWDFSVMSERLANDERCVGPGLAAYFVNGVLDRDIPIHTGINVQELISDGTRIVGLRATKDGADFFVKANRGVVVAVSSYERNDSYAKTLSHQLNPGSMVMSTIDGAHLRLAGEAGARIARVPDITMLGFVIPGEEQDEGLPLWRGALPFLGLPHCIVVNGAAKRFANESFYRSIFFALDAIDGGTHPWGALMAGDPSNKPNANLGPLSKGPFYAVALQRMAGGGITSTGILADHHCRAIGWDNAPIDGLYVAGNSMARMDNGAIMQSGITNARGMTHGYLAGRHVAGHPSDLLGREIARLGL